MKSIPQYKFYKTKYGEELLIDIVTLESIGRYIDKCPVHTLSYFDITFITDGPGTFFIGDKRYVLGEGDVVFSRPGEVRGWGKRKRPQGYALIFEEEFLLSFFNDSAFLEHLPYFHRERVSAKIHLTAIRSRVEDLLQLTLTEINNGRSKDKHILRALLYEMLMLLKREYSETYAVPEEQSRNRHFGHFIRLVEKDFKTYHDTAHYAGELCIAPNYLNEVVRKYTGSSCKRYIQNKIIQEARTLLAYTALSVSEIAAHLHFENSSYFIRLFRKYTGLTPLQYRERAIR